MKKQLSRSSFNSFKLIKHKSWCDFDSKIIIKDKRIVDLNESFEIYQETARNSINTGSRAVGLNLLSSLPWKNNGLFKSKVIGWLNVKKVFLCFLLKVKTLRFCSDNKRKLFLRFYVYTETNELGKHKTLNFSL